MYTSIRTMVLRSIDGTKMEIELLINVLRAEGKNLAKDVESPIGHISGLLIAAANVIEEQVKLGDELHTAMHHALQSTVVDSPNTDGLCDWWELTRS
jgi:hypothetical protein